MSVTPIPQILKLDDVVINRIAAGEVIQRPANAVKEMIENCLDAQSKSIQVTVKGGGLKLLQIVDDGCGIRKEDMSIVCERFTTSKLSKFDDLKSISTYGFRGEALASISHVAHLTITTKTADSACAYKAKYENGKMVPLHQGGQAIAKPCAGNKGTQIVVEDLFYNVAVRRKALKNPNEEHLKIVDVISKYAIHNPTVGFTFKKFGDNNADVRTQQNSSIVDNIKNIYGLTVATELLEITHEDSKYGFKLHGYVSNANYSIKKSVFLLFINHRLVESSGLKKALDAVYVNYLPKDKHPFMYMSLEINPWNCDVNVHPTKHEVKFLHEEYITEQIQRIVESKLLKANESRKYYTQKLLTNMVSAGIDNPLSEILKSNTPENEKVYAHQMVRTDAREQKLEAFYYAANKSSLSSIPSVDKATKNFLDENVHATARTSAAATSLDELTSQDKPCDIEPDLQIQEKNIDSGEDKRDACSKKTHSPNNSERPVASLINSSRESACKKAKFNESRLSSDNNTFCYSGRNMNLSSVKNLCKLIDDREHLGLKSILEDHKFVGCVNKTLTLIQHLTRLYLVNSHKLSQELFYQIILFKFGNFGYIQLSSPAPIHELVMLALNSPQSGWTPEDGDKEELAKFVVDLFSRKAEMLLDYFSMEINKNYELVTLPLLLAKYVPNLNGLPMFLLRLATEVNWESEQECFNTFALECSRFYAFGQDPLDPSNDSGDDKENEENWNYLVEHLLFPTFRTSLHPPKRFSEDGTFLEIANLPDLYKVFERC